MRLYHLSGGVYYSRTFDIRLGGGKGAGGAVCVCVMGGGVAMVAGNVSG